MFQLLSIARAAGAFALVALCSHSAANAATRIALDQTVIEVTANPGQYTAATITFSNRGDAPATYRLATLDPSPDGWMDETQPVGTHPLSAGLWSALTPDSGVIGVGESLSVQIGFTPPSDAVGGYFVIVDATFSPWKSVAALTSDPERDLVARPQIDTMFRIPVYVSIDGTEREVVTVRALVPDSKAGEVPGSFTLTVSNDGNVHFIGAPRLTVVDQSGDVAYRGTAGVARLIAGQWGSMQIAGPETLPPGEYTALVSFLTQTGVTSTGEVRFEVSGAAP